jgi:hypothetical protein
MAADVGSPKPSMAMQLVLICGTNDGNVKRGSIECIKTCNLVNIHQKNHWNYGTACIVKFQGFYPQYSHQNNI